MGINLLQNLGQHLSVQIYHFVFVFSLFIFYFDREIKNSTLHKTASKHSELSTAYKDFQFVLVYSIAMVVILCSDNNYYAGATKETWLSITFGCVH